MQESQSIFGRHLPGSYAKSSGFLCNFSATILQMLCLENSQKKPWGLSRKYRSTDQVSFQYPPDNAFGLLPKWAANQQRIIRVVSWAKNKI